MIIENGKLINYNYYDIQTIVAEAVKMWGKSDHGYLKIESFKKFVKKL